MLSCKGNPVTAASGSEQPPESAVPADGAARRVNRIDRHDAIRLTIAELDAFVGLLRVLDEADWQRPTDNNGWPVQTLVAQVTGQFQDLASFATFIRRARVSRSRYPERPWPDAYTRQHVDELGRLDPDALTALLANLVPAVARTLHGVPSAMRRLPVSKFLQGIPLPEDRLGYLYDVLVPRRTWLNRLDIAHAAGREFVPHDHDRIIVTQVVHDIERQWTGPPVTLDLTGAAGGTWALSDAPPQATVRTDAVGLLQYLAGRDPGGKVDTDDATVAALAQVPLAFDSTVSQTA
jgi:uncharacterized protein (TIGR03083 family)